MGMTITEKIFARACNKERVRPGDIVFPEPDFVAIHDGYVPWLIKDWEEIGIEPQVWNPDKVIFVTDHGVPWRDASQVEHLKLGMELARKLKLKHWLEAGRWGHGHIAPMEMGLIRPGMLVPTYDTHGSNFGAVNAWGSPFTYEISTLVTVGTVWMRVPQTIRVNIRGELPPKVGARDIANKVCADIGAERGDYTTIEFGGPTEQKMGIGDRIILCNIPIEIGAKSAICEPDELMLEYVRERAQGPFTPVYSDPDCEYAMVVDFDCTKLEPQVSAPPTPDNVFPVSQLPKKKIQVASICGCASGMMEELRMAAHILRNRKVASGVRMIVVPQTQQVYAQAADEGLLQLFARAGALILPYGCWGCATSGNPLLPGEVGVGTVTRNDPGRQGAMNAEMYLGSAAFVAASAVKGAISDPREFA